MRIGSRARVLASSLASVKEAGECIGVRSNVLVAMCSELCPALKSDMCSDISSGMYFWRVLSHQTGRCPDMCCDIWSDFGSAVCVLPCIPICVLPSNLPFAPPYVLTSFLAFQDGGAPTPTGGEGPNPDKKHETPDKKEDIITTRTYLLPLDQQACFLILGGSKLPPTCRGQH